MTNASQIEEEAATWLIRRDSGARPDDDAEFAGWLAVDARHRAAYVRLSAALERTVCLKNLRRDGVPIDADLLARPGRSSFRSRGAQWWSLAATVAVVFVAVTWWWFQQGGAQTYRTDIGDMSRVILSDGSAVTLNTDSELRVRFTNAKRTVMLLRGEAQFAVAHNARRPFEVLARDRVVRAVGTVFDVRMSGEQSMTVLVTEGRVAVAARASTGNPAATTTVDAGEVATVSGGSLTVTGLSASEAARRMAWRNDQLDFQGETLAEAVAEFNRYNRRQIRIEDSSLEQINVGGSFKPRDIDSFVAALERSFGIKVRTSDSRSVVLVHAQEGP